MGQLLHGSACTTAPLRRTVPHSQESIARLVARYDLNAKTVAKWCKRTSVEEARMGPRQPHSTVLTMKQEAVIVAFVSGRCLRSTIASMLCKRASLA